MKHLIGFLAIVLTLTGCGDVTQTQQPAKTPRIGFLLSAPRINLIWNHSGEGCEIWATADYRDQTSAVGDRKSRMASSD